MDKGFIFGVLALMGVQFLTAILGMLIYSRQKSALSIEQRDRGEFRPLVQKALALAADALAGVDRIDIEQYRTLAKKLGEAYADIEQLKAKIAALQESIASCHNKLASRDRADKRKEQPDPPEAKNGELIIPSGVDPLEWMKAQGVATPLPNNVVGIQQQTIPFQSSFGRKIGGNQ